MHEAGIAESLLEIIIEHAHRQNATPVRANVTCGEFSGINVDALTFAFEAIAENTVCRDLKLVVELKPVQARCGQCAKIFKFELGEPKCPDCGSENYELLPEEPMMLEEIEFQKEEQ